MDRLASNVLSVWTSVETAAEFQQGTPLSGDPIAFKIEAFGHATETMYRATDLIDEIHRPEAPQPR